MKLLLDTHALLWWLKGDTPLSVNARRMILDRANQTVVSVVSYWEIVIKTRLGKLEVSIDELEETVIRNGFQVLGVDVTHLRASSRRCVLTIVIRSTTC